MMKTRPLGTSQIQLSPIIMGTWQTGRTMWAGIDDKESRRAIRAAYDNGINGFDSAEVYGNGHSERILGQALGDVRDKVIYATKVFSNHLTYDQVIKACHRSLKNLDTDWIDLYQIHWPPGSFGHRQVPMEETMRAMNDLKQQGKIKAIGVSNFNREQIELARQYGPVESLQPPYSLFWRWVEKDTAPYCREHQMSILAYSSMAQGLLTGKFGPGHRFEKGDHRANNRLFEPDHYQRVQQALAKLKPIAGDLGITMGQLALAWVIAQPGTMAIAGARSAAQAEQNAAAGRIHLSESIRADIDRIGRLVTDHLDDNPVLWKW